MSSDGGDVWRSVSDFLLMHSDGVGGDEWMATVRDVAFFRTIGQFAVDPRWILVISLEFATVYMLAQQLHGYLLGNRQRDRLVVRGVQKARSTRDPTRERKGAVRMVTPSLKMKTSKVAPVYVLNDDEADDGLACVVSATAYADVGNPLPAYRAPVAVRAKNATVGSNVSVKVSRGKLQPKVTTTNNPTLTFLHMYAHGDDGV